MKKVLIVSDTHGNHRFFEKVVEAERPFDLLLHLGDTEGGEDFMKELAGCPAYFVSGNNDFYSDLPDELFFEYEGIKIYMTHGHGYYVSIGEERLKKAARKKGADIAMYGHTHRPSLNEDNGLVTLNPGSLQYPRQRPRRPTYMVMIIEDDGQYTVQMKYAN